MHILSLLRSTEVFKEFDADALFRLAERAWVEEYSSGQVIIAVGQKVETVGVVVSGRVCVMLRNSATKRKPISISPGNLFGEISLLTGEPAIADVIASTPSRIVHIPQEALTREIGHNPRAAQPLARLLTKHLTNRLGNPEEVRQAERASVVPQRKNLAPGISLKSPVLVLNLGSSTIKYALFAEDEKILWGRVEIGASGEGQLDHTGPLGQLSRTIHTGGSHAAALGVVIDLLAHPEHGAIERLEELAAVGHRTVHGGTAFTEATLITPSVKEQLRQNAVLAPLHNPINLAGIEICEGLLPPGTPQVAVFDTAFHMTMPEHAYRYGLPTGLADRLSLRRFGFHGTSHKYVTRMACSFLEKPPNSLKIISCHLGNGASIAAVDHGRSIDTSMGMTPLEGLIMGSRSGDLDPGLILHLLRQGMKREEIDDLLNRSSGLRGLSGLSGDMRELEKAADTGHPGALLAIQSFCYRARKYIGAYCAAMGGCDALVFTGGIGENGAGIRSRICHGLGFLSIVLDERINAQPLEPGAAARMISRKTAGVKVLVVPTDEESAIAVDTVRAMNRSGVTDILSARKDRPIPIGVSAHHVHLTGEHVEKLFGKGYHLSPATMLGQPGQFACEETVDLVGPKGTVDRVRVLGPTRRKTQVEISRTEEYKLGIDAPIRPSGDLGGSPGVTLVGSKGQVDLDEGVICAQRHIHMAPQDALVFGLKNLDTVRVALSGERSLIYGDVLVRIHPEYTLEMHLDTDEANAAEVSGDTTATVESIQRRGT